MTASIAQTAKPAAALTGSRLLLALVACNALLIAGSYAQVPMYPVPMTLQTLTVVLVGGWLGPRLGPAVVLAWLAEAALGAPVLAGGAGGLGHFIGPTAGYIWSFPVMAAMMGAFRARGSSWSSAGINFAVIIAAHIVGLCFGAVWLSTLVGAHRAIEVGVLPFLSGSVLKAALGAVTFAFQRRR